MTEKIIKIFADYLDLDQEDVLMDSSFKEEWALEEDDYINLSDIISEEIGVYISPDEIEVSETIEELVEQIEENLRY